jgi:hypothetical protein
MQLGNYFTHQGYTRLEANANINIKKGSDGDGFTILTVYVDDCIVVSNKVSLIQLIKELLQKEIEMTGEEEIHYILSSAIIRN